METRPEEIIDNTEDSGQAQRQFLVVEDHPLIASFFMDLLEDLYPDASTHTCSTIEETIVLVKRHPITLLVLDINLVDGISISWIDTIKRLQPAIFILVISSLEEATFGQRSLQTGADGYINKKASVGMISYAVSTILNGQKYLSPLLLDNLLKDSMPGTPRPENPFETLTNREFEIAVLLMKGNTAVEIGQALHLQRSTVSTHKMQILKKLNVENVIELNGLGLRYNVKPGTEASQYDS